MPFTSPVPAQGLVTGGTPFTFTGTNLGVSTLQDTFPTGTLNGALWTPSVTGSGSVSTIAAPTGSTYGNLQLRTGTAISSTARIRSVDTSQYMDAEIIFGLSSVNCSPATRHMRATLGAFQDTNNLFRFVLETDPFGIAQFKLLALSGGATVINTVLATTLVPIGSTIKMRLLRVLSRVLCYLGGAKIYDITWTDGPTCRVEIGLENDSSLTSSATMTVSRYRRLPIIQFGTEPCTQLGFASETRLDGVTPPIATSGAVTPTGSPKTNVSIVSSTGLQSFTNAWTYFIDPDLQRIGAAEPATRLVVTNDPTLRVDLAASSK